LTAHIRYSSARGSLDLPSTKNTREIGMTKGMPRKGSWMLAASAGAAMLVFMAQAAATEPGIYLAVDIGQTSFGLKQSQLAGTAAAALDGAALDVVDLDASLDKHSTRPALRWGYRFSPYLAAEVAVMNLGRADWEGTGTVTDGVDDSDGQIAINLKSRGPAFSVLGSWPVGARFSVDGQAGFYYFKTTQAISFRFGSEIGSSDHSRRETGVLVGAGGTWSLSRAAALRLSYTLFPGAAGKRDAGRIAVGFQYSLGQ
jgi:opacity protein-like surface antigen